MGFIANKILNTLLFDIGNLAFLLLLFFALKGQTLNKHVRDQALRALSLIVFLLALPAFFPVGDWMLRPLENRFPTEIPEKVDGILMITGDERPSIAEARGEGGLGTVSGRYLKLAALARTFPAAKLAFSGGTGFVSESDGNLKTSDVARRAFASLGLDPAKIVFEDQSRTTFENATFAAQAVQPKPEENWLLITSAFHMPRAMATFRAQGWNVYPVPVDYVTTPSFRLGLSLDFARNLSHLALALHEDAGLVVYWLQGKIAKPWL